MTESLTINFAEPFPLFPLPQCVLLPHATIPLHIFEPRYYQMISDVLDRHGMIAMASFEGQAWQTNYEGSPPIRPYVCLGHIVRHEPLPDRRYHILLQGLCRAKLVEELPHTPYRLARLDPIEVTAEPESEEDSDIDPDVELTAEEKAPEIDADAAIPGVSGEVDPLKRQRKRIERLLHDAHLRQLAGVSAISHWITDEVPTPALVDLATMALCDDHEARYSLLAEPDAAARARWLEQYLNATRRSLALAQKFAPPDMPDGLHLN